MPIPVQFVNARVQQTFATLADMTAANPILLEGEVWIEKDATTSNSTGRRKVGDGVMNFSTGIATGTPFNLLPFEAVPQGPIAAYTHDQPSPDFTWTINHNLGYRPSVELFDSGSQEFDAEVSHPTVNQAVVTLTIATSGFARLI